MQHSINSDYNSFVTPQEQQHVEFKQQDKTISWVVKRAFKSLAACFVISEIVSASHFLLYSSAASWTAIEVSSVALGILAIAVACHYAIRYLPSNIQKVAYFVESVVKEIIIILSLITLYPLALYTIRKLQAKSAENPDGYDIVLLHGYMHNGAGLDEQAEALNQAQCGTVKIFDYNGTWGTYDSIVTYAKRLDQFIQENFPNSNKLVIIGHSMGGVIASYYAAYIAKEDSVKLVATQHSPLEGTKLANLGSKFKVMGKCVDEMKFNSDFLQKLLLQLNPNTNSRVKRTRFCHISSTSDEIVVPWTSARPQHSHPNTRHYQFDSMGHVECLKSKRHHSLLIKQIKDLNPHELV